MFPNLASHQNPMRSVLKKNRLLGLTTRFSASIRLWWITGMNFMKLLQAILMLKPTRTEYLQGAWQPLHVLRRITSLKGEKGCFEFSFL